MQVIRMFGFKPCHPVNKKLNPIKYIVIFIYIIIKKQNNLKFYEIDAFISKKTKLFFIDDSKSFIQHIYREIRHG